MGVIHRQCKEWNRAAPSTTWEGGGGNSRQSQAMFSSGDSTEELVEQEASRFYSPLVRLMTLDSVVPSPLHSPVMRSPTPSPQVPPLLLYWPITCSITPVCPWHQWLEWARLVVRTPSRLVGYVSLLGDTVVSFDVTPQKKGEEAVSMRG